jgi:hypothetical protein
VKPGDRRAVTRAKTTAATKIVSVRLWPSRQTVLDAINSFSDFLGTGETYPVKNGSYVMRCISFIGVLFVCPPSPHARNRRGTTDRTPTECIGLLHQLILNSGIPRQGGPVQNRPEPLYFRPSRRYGLVESLKRCTIRAKSVLKRKFQ